MRLFHGDCLEVLKTFPSGSVDLTVTSPPYDSLRTYNNQGEFTFEAFTNIARELYRVTKEGGVIVWVVNDATISGSETGTSFRQALHFKEIGANLHDTMIYYRGFAKFPDKTRYGQSFEYMFVLSKGTPKTFNPLKEPGRQAGKVKKITDRAADGTTSVKSVQMNAEKTLTNVWQIDAGYMRSTKDKEAYQHPAIFPEQLAESHIKSWSNPNDVVLDPFCGSGTTGKMARLLGREFIGIEREQGYYEIAHKRIFNSFPVFEKQIYPDTTAQQASGPKD